MEKHESEMRQNTIDAYKQLMKMFQTESVMECKECKQKSVAWTMAQTASADESSTIFCKCDICGHEWSFR